MQKLPEKLYLAEHVKEMERLVIQEKGIKGIELMRKAGAAIFSLLMQQFDSRHLIVFCGSGNNAGDGYVVATLALQSGFKVTLYCLADPKKLNGDAQLAFKEYRNNGGVFETQFDQVTVTEGIIIDALLGTGLNRDVTGHYAEAIKLINRSKCPVISVDIPSGLNANTGNVMGHAVKADKTMSFIGLKQGLFTGYAADCCGEIFYSSLDVEEDVFQRITHSVLRIQPIKFAKRSRCAHKGDNGHVLVVGGDAGYAGAITLAAQAALRIGSGLVSVATRKSHSQTINSNQAELMSHGVDNNIELQRLLTKASVAVIGPGLGQTQWAEDLFFTLLDRFGKPLIVDADALNLLAKNSIYRDNWVLTPHPGEAARLLACSTADIAKDRFAAVKKIQKKYGGVVVLKGAGTLIYNGNETRVSPTGNPGMASGGMGDLLSGIIAGLVAQKMTLTKATSLGVYLHGKAADLSAEQAGEIGMVASDLLPIIRQLINK